MTKLVIMSLTLPGVILMFAKSKRSRSCSGCAYEVWKFNQTARDQIHVMKPKSLLCAPLYGSSDRFNPNAVSGRYRRHVDTGVSDQSLALPEEKDEDVRLTFLPERSYQPLVEEGNQQKIKDEKKAKKKEKYKKYRKNIGKALRYSWKCLMLGLQNFSVGYSTPLSAAATMVPADFHPGAAWG